MVNNVTKTESVDWSAEIKKLEFFCQKKGYTVLFQAAEMDAIYFDDKKIIISNHHSNEIGLYCLLHEIGHLLLMKKKSFNNEYQVVYDNFSKSSTTKLLTIVQEELDAWREGLKLANKLNVCVDRRKFEITKSRCITTYLTWVSRKN